MAVTRATMGRSAILKGLFTMRPLFTAAAAGAALAFGLGASAHAYTIDTTPYWDGSTSISAWGGSATNTYGETFTAPGGDLNSFTFYVNDNGTPATFVAEVYAWNGSLTGGAFPQGTGGPALFTSASMTTSGDGAFDAVTINTGGVALTTGQNYVIDLYDNSGDGVAGEWGLTGFYSHPGVPFDGGFNFNNGPSNSPVWDDFGDFGSLAYTASFGAVPEPASWALMLVGFAGIGAAIRSRKGAATTA